MDRNAVFERQVVFCVIGLVLFWVMLRISPTRLRALAPAGMLVCLVLLVAVLIPGTTISLGIVLVAVLFFAGAPMRLMAALAAGAAAGALILGLSAGYRSARITSFLHPGAADPLGAGFQATQALCSLADGGLFGLGLGQSRAKWQYLPNAANDFIFAIIGEEPGFLGAFAVIVLFAAVTYTELRIAARATDPWLQVSAATLTVWLVAQATINIGYVVGLLPVTGIPLPMISSGGTSTVVTMVVFGLLANFARHEPEAIAALRADRPSRRWLAVLQLPILQHYRPPARRGSLPRQRHGYPGGVAPLRR